MDVAMPADPKQAPPRPAPLPPAPGEPNPPPSLSRRRRPARWVSGASTLLAIAALLAVWAVLVAHG